MTDSKKIYKNLVLTIVTALVLVAATLAWFLLASNQAQTNPLEVDALTNDYVIKFYQAIDTNHDNVIDEQTEPYEEIPFGTSLDISDMTPGKTNYYFIELTSYYPKNFTLLLDSITTEIEGELVSAEDLYEIINISISCETPQGLTITPRSSGTMKDYILDYTGTSQIPEEGTLCAKLAPEFFLNNGETVSIYYQIGIDGEEKNLHLTDVFQGAKVNINIIGFNVTDVE
ncbi:MAG: hypothetical protein GX824_07265 [Clostridiales bacterium]|nr:hypothetical protein [Clostridiales bacterium]